MATTATTDATFDADVLRSDTPVVVDFWAEWCSPCKTIGPSLEEISDAMGERVKIVKVNIDENPSTPGKFGVRGIPTLMLFKDGEVKAQKIGAAPKGALQQWVEENI